MTGTWGTPPSGFVVRDTRMLTFLAESNAIENITTPPTDRDAEIARGFIDLPRIRVADVVAFQATIAPGKPLRDKPGMNVQIGGDTPMPGGPQIGVELGNLLHQVQKDGHYLNRSPRMAHIEFEKLHPFLDGNGRTGRLLWAWHMQHRGLDPFALPFLRTFYYQTLGES